jgi:hypothetical protein
MLAAARASVAGAGRCSEKIKGQRNGSGIDDAH